MRGKGALFCRDLPLLLADPSPSMPSSAPLWVCGMGSEQWDGVLQPLPITCAAPNHFSLSFWALATHLSVSQLGCPHELELGPQLAPSHRPPCSVWGCWGQDGAPMLTRQAYPAVSGCSARLPGEGSSPPCQRFQLSVQAPSLHPTFISLGLKAKSWCPCRAEKTVSPVQSVTEVTRKLLQRNQKG